MGALVKSQEIRLAMLGLVEGNGHPYSWSAIFNGYESEAMAHCPYPAIPAYLSRQPKAAFGIPGARVTHIWTDDPEEAPRVARAACIPHILRQAEEAIGQVDAVIVATDRGEEHVARCRPFVEAGLPVYVDKPLVDNEADLQTFCRWVEQGAHILSSSCMRYCKEFLPYRASTHNLGELRFATITTPKSWERYGIHALEGIYPILGPGFLSARNVGTAERNVVHLEHTCGADIIAAATSDMYGGFGALQLCGTAGHAQAAFADTFYAFKAQLADFIGYLRTGVRSYSFTETVELMRLLIAGIRSREEGGRRVPLCEISPGVEFEQAGSHGYSR
ncbi:MAG TPA: Gfo/Idh/MocA family oxidoreductase [Chthonomonadaceae bacterium]|nr:Gfo/Idh/MocA family oxidoreductase [Chthonomonadaceae bacterium]